MGVWKGERITDGYSHNREMVNTSQYAPKLAQVEACTGCSACNAVCRSAAISMAPDEEGFFRPRINYGLCVGCGMCEKVCPVLKETQASKKPICFALQTSDAELLAASTSGGAFSELAIPVLHENGCVFGCVLEPDRFCICHKMAETEGELSSMRGSKYVQSDLRCTFRECLSELKNGRKVLFSGTPCQIAGLKAYIGKSFSNLLLVDIICHGISSPGAFAKYCMESRRVRKNWILDKITFRNKKSKIRYALALRYHKQCGKGYKWVYDRYYNLTMLNDLALRQCCYDCHFRGGVSGADLTIADFWQVEKCGLDLSYGDDGMSLVLAHSDKGISAIEKLRQAGSLKVLIEVPAEDALRGNPSYFESPPLHPRRSEFFRRIKKERVSIVAKKILIGTFYERAIRKMRRLYQRVFN